MKKTLSLLSLFAFSIITKAQELHIEWNRFIGGDGSCWAQIRSSIATSDNGILFIGSTSCDDKGDIPPYNVPGTDVFVGKLDSSQQLSWVRMLGGNGADYGDALTEFPNGDFGIGITTSSLDLPGFHDGSDIFLVRLANDGTVKSQKCYGGYYAETVISLVPTEENGLVVLATSTGASDDVPSHYGGSMFLNDWWLFKTDSSGNIIWSKVYGGTDDEHGGKGSLIAIDTSYYIFGSSRSTDHDCTDTAWHSGTNSWYDLYLLKTDTAGNLLWSKSYGGTGYERATMAIHDSTDSTVVMLGESQSYDHNSIGNHGGPDQLVVKADLNGNVIWNSMLGTSSQEFPKSICRHSSIGYYVVGNTDYGTIGGQDGVISYIGINGDSISRLVFGSISHESVASVHQYNEGFVTTGSTQKTSFTEGVNIWHQGEGPAAFSFISKLEYWPLNIANLKEESTLLITPNPAQNIVQIKLPNEKGRLVVWSMNGKKMFQKKIRKETQYIEIGISDWSKGIYLVQWESENGGVLAEKLVNN